MFNHTWADVKGVAEYNLTQKPAAIEPICDNDPVVNVEYSMQIQKVSHTEYMNSE